MSNLNVNQIAEDISDFFDSDSKNVGHFLAKVAIALIVYLVAAKLIRLFCDALKKPLKTGSRRLRASQIRSSNPAAFFFAAR